MSAPADPAATRLRLANDASGEPEIFRSIQGEGRSAGQVRTFIRLSGCNLHCVWCDTAYTWNWEGGSHAHVQDRPDQPHQFSPAREITALPAADAARRALALAAPGYVITGGEPLVQQAGAAALIDALRASQPDALIEVETNGAIVPSRDLLAHVDQWNVSPKLAHSGNEVAVAINPDALALYALRPNAFLKIVAREPADLDAVDAIVAATGFPPARVDVMPEGTESETLRERARVLIDPVLTRGYGFSDRLHIHLFGARRGV